MLWTHRLQPDGQDNVSIEGPEPQRRGPIDTGPLAFCRPRSLPPRSTWTRRGGEVGGEERLSLSEHPMLDPATRSMNLGPASDGAGAAARKG